MLSEGEAGASLLAWLNSLIEVRIILASQFEGPLGFMGPIGPMRRLRLTKRC